MKVLWKFCIISCTRYMFMITEKQFVYGAPHNASNSTRVDTASTWETWIRMWTSSLFLDANTASMPDIGIVWTGLVAHDWKPSSETRICVTFQWITVDHMTLSIAKLNLIWTAAVNSCALTGESQTQSRSITSVHPLHYFATNAEFFTIRTSTNKIWCLDFDSPSPVT